MKETFKMLEISEYKFVKTINIVGKNQLGNDFIFGFIIYERNLHPDYKFKSKDNDEKDWFKSFNYPNQSDYPNDEIDNLLLSAIQERNENSYTESKLLYNSSHIEGLINKTNRPSEKAILLIEPNLAGKDLYKLPNNSITMFKKKINVFVKGSSELIKNLRFEAYCNYDRQDEIYDKLNEIEFK